MRAVLILSLVIFLAIGTTNAAASQWSLGVHVGSVHLPQEGQNNVNPGVYIRMDEWQVGCYHNSYDRTSCYAGYALPFGPVEILLGVASGYQEKCNTTWEYTPRTVSWSTECSGFSRGALTPTMAFSYTAPFSIGGVTPVATLVPGFGGKAATVFHLSLKMVF